MNTHFVTYSLDNPSESYDAISSHLKQYHNWAKLFSRAWIIKTIRSSRSVRNELVDIINGKGKVVVINITDSAWATYGIDADFVEWMKDNV